MCCLVSFRGVCECGLCCFHRVSTKQSFLAVCYRPIFNGEATDRHRPSHLRKSWSASEYSEHISPNPPTKLLPYKLSVITFFFFFKVHVIDQNE